MTDSRLASIGLDHIRGFGGQPLLASVGLDVLFSVAENLAPTSAQLSSIGMDVVEQRTATPAELAQIGLEVIYPVPYVVSASDRATYILQKHTDGEWRPFLIAAVAPNFAPPE